MTNKAAKMRPDGNGSDDVGKRLFDIILALLLVLPALLVCGVFVILIRIVDRSPALFIQERVGQRNRRFRLYKLRTMRPNSPNIPTHEASISHITPLGGLLRRTKLDELPQLINVLRGDMSFVGPRPCLPPSQSELIGERDKRGVSAMRPGITGISQIAGLDMSDPVALAQSDAAYKHRWSLATDFAILARTLVGRGRGDALIAADSRLSRKDVQDR
jgi:O-antigen biosynthesis protein WbqP